MATIGLAAMARLVTIAQSSQPRWELRAIHTSAHVSDSTFAMAFGGGLDWKAGDHILVRVAQADYLYTKHDFSFGVPGIATHQNNIRLSAGIVYVFGGH